MKRIFNLSVQTLYSIILCLCVMLIGCTKEIVPITVTGVTLSPTSITLVEGESQSLTAVISPSNAENQQVRWSSSDASVATVADGKITAIKAGNATITVTTEDGGKTATCAVKVTAKVYPVIGVSLDKTTCELTVGEEVTLIATVKPDNATNKNVTWKTSDATIATVVNGKVTAIKAGNATITVTTEDGNKTATCEIKVTAKVYPVTGVSLDKTSCELTEGDELTLTATINPDNATNKNVTWSTSDASVATVADGKITAIKAGNATITVTTEDGGKTATCAVKVTAKVYPVTGVSLDKTTCELTVGGDVTLTATINPANATNKNVTWKTSDATVATVVNGKVTALKAGTATITVTTEDGGKTATCVVTVKATVSTEKDEGNLNYGSEGGAGDNISEKEIINGGSH